MRRSRAPAVASNAPTQLAALVLLLTGLVACEPDAPQPIVEEDAAPAAAPAPSAAPVETARGEPGTAAAQAQAVAIRITADGMEVTPTAVRPGNVTFQATNNASVPFDVDIDGPGQDTDFEDLQPNETRSITMTLQAGSYEIESDSEVEPEKEYRTTLAVRD